MEKLQQRLSEPSTYAGASAILMGLDKILNLHGVPEVAQVVAQAGEVAASGSAWYMPLFSIVLGALAIFKPEVKAKK